jgi:DNA-binding transcriptional LysR family regulator
VREGIRARTSGVCCGAAFQVPGSKSGPTAVDGWQATARRPVRLHTVSTLPQRLAARYVDRLDLFDLPFDARGFSLFAAWHPRNQSDPGIVWLRDTLSDMAAS